jgi:hypothetical protein
MFVCPYWRGKEDKRVGDVNGSSFQDVWGGELRKQVMAKLDPSKDCGFHCLRHDTNVEAITIRRKLVAGVQIAGTEEHDRFI